MDKTNSTQKKNNAMSYVYATIVAMLVVACAITIALVNSKDSKKNLNVGVEETVPVSGTTYVLPMNGATISKDYSSTELQYNDTLKQWEIHKAIDFLAGEDKSVYAVAAGTISNIFTNYLEGTVVEITHKDGVVSIYKSLAKEVAVSVGTKVGAGDKIGQVDESMAQEINTGAHLHFEMQKNGKKVDPNNYLNLGNK